MSQNPATTLYQQLTQNIADYNGYEELQNRQKTDHTLRRYLIDHINHILSLLSALPQTSIEEDQALLTDYTKSTHRMLSTFCQSLTDPTYNESTFFTAANLPVKRLEKIYHFENTMMVKVSDITVEVETLKKNDLLKHIIEDHFLHIKDFIDNFNQALFERESLILGDNGL